MKKAVFISGTILMAVVFWLVLGAAAPNPIFRNQWTTNFPGQAVHGGTFFDANMVVNNILISAVTPEILFILGQVGDLGWDTGGVSLLSGNTTVSGWYTQTGTGSTNISTILGRAPISLFGSTNVIYAPTNASDGYVLTSDAVGNGRWLPLAAGTNIVTATLTTTDNTTNTIYSFTPANNMAIRVWADIVGFNSTSSASYSKIATFKNVATVVTQIAGTSTIGSAEDDAAFEALIDLSGTTIRIRVAGNTAKTVNWTAAIHWNYAP